VQLYLVDVEVNRAARRETRQDEIPHDFLLAVDGDGPTTGELGQRGMRCRRRSKQSTMPW